MFPKVFNPRPEKRERKFPKFLVIIFLVLLCPVLIIYSIFYSKIFLVQDIIIDQSLPEEIQRITQNYQGKNIFFFNSAELEEQIKAKFPEIEKIRIRRGLPDTLRISAESSLAKIIWQSQGHSFLVNDAGYLFKEVEGAADLPLVIDSKDLPVKISDQVASTNLIDFLDEISSKFAAKIGFKIINFEMSETIFQIDALTDQGWFVKFDTTRAVDDQLDALSQFLAGHKDDLHEYADVRVEGKVYWK